MDKQRLISTLSGLVLNAQDECSNQARADDLADFESEMLELIQEQMKTKPCEWCELETTEKIFAYGMNFKKIAVNYCPNCGRKLKGENNERD